MSTHTASSSPWVHTSRIPVLLDGGAPPDGKNVRYYKMSHSTITGWCVRRETTAFSYYTKLF